MTEPKVGDKIRVLEDRACAAPVVVGDTGEITGFGGDSDGSTYAIVTIDRKEIAFATWSLTFDKFEVIEPAIKIVDGYEGVRLKVKKLVPEAVVPSYAKPGDAGLDLTATSFHWDDENGVMVFGTGIAVEIPKGFVGLIFPRSSIYKTSLMLANCVGVIDSGYRGEIKFMFRPVDRPSKNYKVGDRIGQMIIMPFPEVSVEQVEELSDSERGTGGFGSSGT